MASCGLASPASSDWRAQSKVAALRITLARLQAEVYGKPLRFEDDLKAFPDYIRNQTDLYNKRQTAYKDDISSRLPQSRPRNGKRVACIGAGPASYVGVAVPVVAMTISTLLEGYRWTPLAIGGSGKLDFVGVQKLVSARPSMWANAPPSGAGASVPRSTRK